MIENEPGGERRACETWNPRKITKGSSAKGTTEESDQRNIVIIFLSNQRLIVKGPVKKKMWVKVCSLLRAERLRKKIKHKNET
jgi:hypothetical protein